MRKNSQEEHIDTEKEDHYRYIEKKKGLLEEQRIWHPKDQVQTPPLRIC